MKHTYDAGLAVILKSEAVIVFKINACRWYHGVVSRGTAGRSVVPILSRFLERSFVSPRERHSFRSVV